MGKIVQFGRGLRQFRWWSLLAAVLVAVLVWQWFDGRLGSEPGLDSPSNLTIDRSFPSPITGLVLNLGGLHCWSGPGFEVVGGSEAKTLQTCNLELEYENVGGLVDLESDDCPVDPGRFLVLIDRQGRHYSPVSDGCPFDQSDWPKEVGQLMSAPVSFNLSSEAVAIHLLVVGQLIDFDNPGQVATALAVGETFSGQAGVIEHTAIEFSCQILADADRDEAYRWWRRLTNDINTSRYNSDRNLTVGKVSSRWQVCQLVVDYRNASSDTDLLWEDSCQLAVYRHARLVDSRGRQYKALGDHICQSGETVWPPGSQTSETIEFAVDRWSKIERILLFDQLVDPIR